MTDLLPKGIVFSCATLLGAFGFLAGRPRSPAADFVALCLLCIALLVGLAWGIKRRAWRPLFVLPITAFAVAYLAESRRCAAIELAAVRFVTDSRKTLIQVWKVKRNRPTSTDFAKVDTASWSFAECGRPVFVAHSDETGASFRVPCYPLFLPRELNCSVDLGAAGQSGEVACVWSDANF